MKRLFKILTVVFLVIVSSAIFAQEAKMVIEKSQISEGVTLEHRYTPGEMGSFDSLIISKEGKPAVIFNSEGRKIKEVFPLDTNTDGKLEYLVSMDCGGSGGYYDIAIIKEKEDKWISIWENTLPQPKINVQINDGKPCVQIEYVQRMNESMVNSTLKLTFDNESVIKSESSKN